MLINRQAIARHWQTTKRVLGDSWNHALRIGTQLDEGMRVGKRLLGAMAPLLSDDVVRPIMRGVSAYDQGKAEVVHGVNNVQTHLHRIRRQVPEIGL